MLGHRLPRFQLEPLPGWDGGLGEVLQVEGPADKGRPWWRHRVLRSPAGPAAARRARAGKFGQLHGVLRLPFGTGGHAPVAGVDQSYVIAAILENPEPHDRQAYPLYGPVEMDHYGIADAVSRALGIPVTYDPISVEEFVTSRKDAFQHSGRPGWCRVRRCR